MNRIEIYVSNLTSPNKNTRYDACEMLRVEDGLPEYAIAALEVATKDPDPDVADAAQRALTTHKIPSPIIMEEIKKQPSVYPKWFNWVYVFFALITTIFLFVMPMQLWAIVLTICLVGMFCILSILGIYYIGLSMSRNEGQKGSVIAIIFFVIFIVYWIAWEVRLFYGLLRLLLD